MTIFKKIIIDLWYYLNPISRLKKSGAEIGKNVFWGEHVYVELENATLLRVEDKVVVSRARRIQKFLSQPFFVAEQFTSMAGKYVPLAETVRGFKEILEGKHDDLPEQAFYMVGTIEDAVEKAKTL